MEVDGYLLDCLRGDTYDPRYSTLEITHWMPLPPAPDHIADTSKMVPEQTNAQCLEFLSVAFRHDEIKEVERLIALNSQLTRRHLAAFFI